MPTSPDRVAIVTGGTGGIGQVVAERLAADGQKVLICYAGSEGRAKEVVETITTAGGVADAMQTDVADEAAVAALFDRAEELYGGIDVVVHTAGIMLLAPLAQLDLVDFDRMHRINLRGTFVVNQQAARRVRRGGAALEVHG